MANNKSQHSDRAKKETRFSISEQMAKTDFKFNRLWSITDGQFATVINGETITNNEFDELHPIPVVINFASRKENPDKRNKYLFT